jgi:hypothetical protein
VEVSIDRLHVRSLNLYTTPSHGIRLDSFASASASFGRRSRLDASSPRGVYTVKGS